MYTQVKTNYQEPLYMFSEAEKFIDYQRYKSRQRQKVIKKYFIKQKFAGATMLIIGIVTPILLQDLTFSLFAIPFGIFLMVTKQRIITVNQ